MKTIVHLDSDLHSANLEGLRVLLRADLNIPMTGNILKHDHRLKAILPTIKLIREKGGKVILASHIGRPQNRESELSTQKLIPWFEQQGFTVSFAADLETAHKKSIENFGDILLLENLRFFPGEREKDPKFVHALANLADYYINDAFALLHRNDASITDVPALFEPGKRTIGLLIEHELKQLNLLLEHPRYPFVLIVGGAKIRDKIPLLQSFVNIVDTILLCPAVVFTFLKAQNRPIGKSLVDDNLLEISRKILKEAEKEDVRIVFPVDYQIALETFDGPISYIDSTHIPKNAVGVSIGPKTETLFSQEIEHAKTIFFNGAPGNLNKKETLKGIEALFKAMAKSDALTIIGGGDSVAIAHELELADQMDYCSTGGGATLAYLSGQPLPGLTFFISE